MSSDKVCIGKLKMRRHLHQANAGYRDSQQNEKANDVAECPPKMLAIALQEVADSAKRDEPTQNLRSAPKKARMKLHTHRPNQISVIFYGIIPSNPLAW